MRVTNNFNLPQSVYEVLSETHKPHPDKLWVTHLINSPLQRQLMLKYWDELVEDASDRLWSLLGKMGHKVFETSGSKHIWAEKHIDIPVDKFIISGTLDRYDTTTGTLEDFKFTSVYSFLLGDKPEWEAQLNVYSWLITKHIQKENIPDICQPKRLCIEAILRDWMRSKTTDWDYPKTSFMSTAIPNWGFEKQDEYIRDRVRLHLSPANECTPEEKWTRPSKFALMKEGRKSAVKVEDTEKELWEYCVSKKLLAPANELKLKSGHSIVERVGCNIKCENYCVCRSVCPYV